METDHRCCERRSIGYWLTGAIATDFVGIDQAVFGMPEVKVGVPTIVGSMRIPSKVAWADAMEIC